MKNSKFNHQLIQVGEYDGGKVYDILVWLPTKIGWISDVKFSIASTTQKKSISMEHQQNEDGIALFKAKDVRLETKAVYHYYFSFKVEGNVHYLKKENKNGDSWVAMNECWKLAVGFEVPKWTKGAIMYHIFVDRYRRGSKEPLVPMVNRTIHSNWTEKVVLGPDEQGRWNIDFFGGDLKGIEESLDYIKKLGVTIIYLSPIPESQSTHRYDAADFTKIDPYAGTEESIKDLCRTAHKKGMKIILDAVFNHTGNDSIYFNQYGKYPELGAYQSPDSKYFSFYKKKWNEKKKIEEFCFWWNMLNLPECDGNSQKWKDYIFGKGGVIDLWFSWGIDGLRLDVADELTDEFIEGIRIAVKRNNPDGFIIGEVWKNPMKMKRGYLESGKCMDSVMNYQLVDALIRYFKYSDDGKLSNIIDSILSSYPEDTIKCLMNFTSTHDISRCIEIFSRDIFKEYGEWAWNVQNDSFDWIRNNELSDEEYKYGRRVMMAYMFVLYFWPGIVSIFYGDEVGTRGVGNLANRAPYPWKYRDKKILKYLRTLGKIRNQEEFLKDAGVRVWKVTGERFVFERYNDNIRMLVAVSRVDYEQKLNLPEGFENSEIVYSLNGSTKNVLKPFGAVAIKIKK